MRTAPGPNPRDPEFDGPPRPAGQGPPPGVIRFYQRLVVNPFLAVVAALLTLDATSRLGNSSRSYLIPAAAFAGTVASVLVLQYHCLDCAATGWFHRWRRHACPRVVERWLTPYSAASLLFPSPGTQVILWILALLVGAFLWSLGHIE